MKHTPGPWTYDKNLGCRAIKGGKSGTHRQAQYYEIANTIGLYDDGEDLANARLIAAAPRMLKGLERAEQTVRNLAANLPPDGDLAQIARNEATNLRDDIAAAEGT